MRLQHLLGTLLLLTLIIFMRQVGLVDEVFRRPIDDDQSTTPSSHTTSALHTCQIRNKTYSFPQVPSFIIIGAQKAGTSALADYLKEHPSLLTASNGDRDLEQHYLDWMVPGSASKRRDKMMELNITEEDDLWCHYRRQYAQLFDLEKLATSASLLQAFEKTPSYMFHGYYLPQIVQKVCPWKPKLIAILRNPIDRAFSQYSMLASQQKNPSRFEEILENELEILRTLGLSTAPSIINDGSMPNPSQFELPNLTLPELDAAHKTLFRRAFLNNHLQRGMYAIQLQHWIEMFGDRLLLIRFEDLYSASSQTHQQEEYSKILNHIGVSPVPLPIPNATHWSRRRYSDRLSNRTREYLRLFFAPHNKLLVDMLGGRGSWDWDNS